MLINKLSGNEIGKRMRIARESAGISQSNAAKSIDVARTTLVAIEKGQRRLHHEELSRLVQLYGTSANAIMRQEAVHVNLVPEFRKLRSSTDQVVYESARLLNNLVQAEVELENILQVSRKRNYPPERPIMPGNVRIEAEEAAFELRHFLGLSFSPVKDLVSLLEMDLGIRIYVRKLHSSVAGLFAYDDTVGACILVNAMHDANRRAFTISHELGHFVSVRHEREVLYEGKTVNTREERYANAFAAAFLTPARTVMQSFREITIGASHLTRRHVILLSHTFGVSRAMMVRRLEQLELIKRGSWEWFEQNEGITDKQASQVLGDSEVIDRCTEEAQQPTTRRLSLLAAAAWRRDLLSEGQLSQLLQLDRLSVRKILDDEDIGLDQSDGMPKLTG